MLQCNLPFLPLSIFFWTDFMPYEFHNLHSSHESTSDQICIINSEQMTQAWGNWCCFSSSPLLIYLWTDLMSEIYFHSWSGSPWLVCDIKITFSALPFQMIFILLPCIDGGILIHDICHNPLSPMLTTRKDTNINIQFEYNRHVLKCICIVKSKYR